MKGGSTGFPWRIAAIFLVSRIFLEIIGILSLFYFPSARALFRMTDLAYHAPQPAYLEIWARWDSEWFLLVADKGYASYESFKDFGHGKYQTGDTAQRFPAYPLAIRLLHFAIPNSVLCGILISNIAALVFLYYLFRLGEKLFDADSAEHSAVFYFLFPTAFFLSAVYSESLFLAAITAGFFYLEEKKLGWACLAIAIAVLTRAQATLAAPALLLLAIRQFPENRLQSASLVFLAVVLPLAGYFLYLQHSLGSFRWLMESEKYWRGEMRYPLYAFVRFAQSNIAIHGQHNSIIDFSFALVNLIVLVFSIRKLPAPYYIYSLLVVLFPLSSTLFSFSRLCLANFPFFLYLGSRLSGRWALMAGIGCVMLEAFFMAAFANWYWVG